MQAVFLTLLGISLGTSAVILLVKVLSPFFEKRFHAKWKYWVWLILALRLLIPFHISIQAPRVQVQVPPVLSSPLVVVDTPPAAPSWEIPGQTGIPQAPASAQGVFSSISPLDILAVVWILGALVFLAYQVAVYCRFYKRLTRWVRPVEQAQTLALYAQVKEEMGITANIPLLYSEMVQSPMMLGFFRPLLVLPFCDWAPQDLSFILRHELTHYRRRDLYYKLLLVICNALHWFNPFVYLMVRCANADLELACDSEVIKNLDFEGKKAYSETILASIHRQQRRQTALSTYFWGGTKMMKKRFQNILSTRNRRRGVAAATVLALCGVLAGSLVACSPGKASVSASPTPEEVVAAYYNSEKEQPYTLSLQVHTIQEDPDETSRVRVRLAGSDLARENGWDDTFLEQNVTAVYASYTVAYDHTLTFKEEGEMECFVYLTRENANSEWKVWDVSYDMSSRENRDENVSSQPAPVLSEETAQKAIRQILSSLVLQQNGDLSFAIPAQLPQDPSGQTLLNVTLNATYRTEPGDYSSFSLLDWETGFAPGQKYSANLNSSEGELIGIMLRVAYMTQVGQGQYQTYAADYIELNAPFSYGENTFTSPSVQIETNGQTAQLLYTARDGKRFSVSLTLPEQTTVHLVAEPSVAAESFPTLALSKDGLTIGTLCLYGYGTTDTQVLQEVDPASATLPMPIYSTIALPNHVNYQNEYRVISSTQTSSNARCRMLYQDLSLEEGGSAVSLPWLENDCVLAYNLASEPYFVCITLSPDALSSAQLDAMAASIVFSNAG